MNQNKRIMIIVAIVFTFVSMALNLFWAIWSLVQTVPLDSFDILYVVYEFLGVAGNIIAACLLIYSIAHKGELFRARRSYYMTAVIMMVILNSFTISTILLIATLFMPDIVWVKPHDDVYFAKDDEDIQTKADNRGHAPRNKDVEKKIAELRKLKDDGVITEEEFKDQLFKLL